MKKHLLLIASLFVASNVRAYIFTIKNFTPQSIQASISYGVASLCPPKTRSLKPGARRNVNALACCPKAVKVRKTSGTNTGTWYNFYPSITGRGMSCKNNKMKVSENQDGSLKLESY